MAVVAAVFSWSNCTEVTQSQSLGVKQQLLYMSEHVVCVQFEKKKRKILVGKIVKVQRGEHFSA